MVCIFPAKQVARIPPLVPPPAIDKPEDSYYASSLTLFLYQQSPIAIDSFAIRALHLCALIDTLRTELRILRTSSIHRIALAFKYH